MAEQAVQQPLAKFYDLLDDEQEARLNALAADRRKISPANENPEVSGVTVAESWTTVPNGTDVFVTSVSDASKTFVTK